MNRTALSLATGAVRLLGRTKTVRLALAVGTLAEACADRSHQHGEAAQDRSRRAGRDGSPRAGRDRRAEAAAGEPRPGADAGKKRSGERESAGGRGGAGDRGPAGEQGGAGERDGVPQADSPEYHDEYEDEANAGYEEAEPERGADSVAGTGIGRPQPRPRKG